MVSHGFRRPSKPVTLFFQLPARKIYYLLQDQLFCNRFALLEWLQVATGLIPALVTLTENTIVSIRNEGGRTVEARHDTISVIVGIEVVTEMNAKKKTGTLLCLYLHNHLLRIRQRKIFGKKDAQG